MCKSAMGKCYSQLTYERDYTRSVHGCVESLPQSDKMVCSGQGDIGKFSKIGIAQSAERLTSDRRVRSSTLLAVQEHQWPQIGCMLAPE